MTDKERDELLSRLDERSLHTSKAIDRIDIWLSNHDKEHSSNRRWTLGAVLTSAIAIFIAFFSSK